MDEYFGLLNQYIKDERIRKHCLAVAKIMEKLAEYFNEDKNKWYLVGLLHDIDYEITKENIKEHGIKAEEILKGKVDEDIIESIKAHNPETGVEPKTKMSKALILADQISGLIIATALVMPNKKLDEVKIETLIKKFKQKDFARKIRRDLIQKMCEELNIPLEKVFEIALNALKEIKEDLGL